MSFHHPARSDKTTALVTYIKGFSNSVSGIYDYSSINSNGNSALTFTTVSGISANSSLPSGNIGNWCNSSSKCFSNNGTGVVYANLPIVPTTGTSITATGGTVTTSNGYKIHTYTGLSSTSWTLSSPSSASIQYLIVGGGGGGGDFIGGGGGAGGVSTGTRTLSADLYYLTVGDGGNGSSNSTDNWAGDYGQSTTVTASSTGNSTFYACGGGGGGNLVNNGNLGGIYGYFTAASGGGGGGLYTCNTLGGAGGTRAEGLGLCNGYYVAGKGNNGGNGPGSSQAYNAGGGGGGAGGVGSKPPGGGNNGGIGGPGVYVAFPLGATYYGGGGGGGSDGDGGGFAGPGTGGAGGSGGGGQGGSGTYLTPYTGYNGTANTGGGGGGGGNNGIGYGSTDKGGKGGSGIVIFAYALPTLPNCTFLCRFYINNFTSNQVIWYNGNFSSGGFGLYCAAGSSTLNLAVAGSGNTSLGTTLTASYWYSCALQYSNSTWNFWINGSGPTSLTNISVSEISNSASYALTLGGTQTSGTASNSLNGYLTDFLVFNDAISSNVCMSFSAGASIL